MTKTLQSNKSSNNMGSEMDAESVPSSLRIVCDDASSITKPQSKRSPASTTHYMSVQKQDEVLNRRIS